MEIQQRHARGVYALACDIEASAHYGLSNTGVCASLWRLGRYVRAFLG